MVGDCNISNITRAILHGMNTPILRKKYNRLSTHNMCYLFNIYYIILIYINILQIKMYQR